MYPIEIRLASKNGWHTPAEAKAYYGRYSREGFTVHWWNTPNLVTDADHDNIVNYILGKATRGEGSVNYVLSNNKITLVVNPDNVAWASQNGNPTTISCEFSPHLNAEGYKKAGWLISELEGRYGRVLNLYKHSNWFSTACPGTLDVARMRAEADKWKSGGYAPKPPAPAPVPVPTPPKPPVKPVVDEWILWKEGTVKYVTNKQPTHLWNFNSTTWQMQSIKPFNKGEIVEIVGQAKNTKLNKVYYVTSYSFQKKIANGFNPVDLDIYVPPRPTPEPPKPLPNPEPTPLPTPLPTPVEPDRNAIIAFLIVIRDMITAFLGKFKKG
jgi:hypothetical protein